VVGTIFNIVIACLAFYFIMKTGMKLLGGFSQPMAEPPPPGEMRKVKLNYRCDVCGSEARMTLALDEDPSSSGLVCTPQQNAHERDQWNWVAVTMPPRIRPRPPSRYQLLTPPGTQPM